uniref:Uncharacterized protein n=1 Tax=Anguilla anguilla TaxID=7936 RepID=A0A0E9VTZ6_ANGAN
MTDTSLVMFMVLKECRTDVPRLHPYRIKAEPTQSYRGNKRLWLSKDIST